MYLASQNRQPLLLRMCRRSLPLFHQRQPCYRFAHPFNGRAHGVLIFTDALDVVRQTLDANDLVVFCGDRVQVIVRHDSSGGWLGPSDR